MMSPRRNSPRDLVLNGAAAYPDRVAIIAGETRLTYAALAQRTSRLASVLADAGVQAGTQVALLFPNSIAFIVWYYAVLQAGGIVMSLAPSLALRETQEFIEASGAQFLAAPRSASLARRLGALQAPDAAHLGEGDLWRIPHGAAALDSEPWTGDGLMLRHHTSGSTGRPKHIFKTETTVAFDLGTFRGTLRTRAGLGANDVFLGALPFHTIYGAKSFTAAFYLGARVSILPRFFPGPALQTVARNKVTAFLASPAMIEALSTCFLRPGEEQSLRSLGYCSTSGAGLRAELSAAFTNRFGVPVHNNYGSTETMSVAADRDGDFEEGRVGRPYPEVDVRIFDRDGNALPAGVQGEIGVRSPGVSTGYIDDPVSSAKLFRNGYAFPGDQGYLDGSNRLHLLGRGDVINIDGMKVDPLEVELVLRRSLAVSEVVVLAGERGGVPAVRAVIEANPKTVTVQMVVEACRAQLAPHKVPAIVEIRERLARDESGKVLRQSLTER